jgi:hypothetical protein
MTHDEARELIGADPDEASTELLAHLHTCPQCQAYRQEMLALNAKLRRALELDWQKVQKTAPPSAPPTEPLPNREAPSVVAPRTAAPVTPRAAVSVTPATAAPKPPTDRPNVPADVSSVTVLKRKAPAPVPKHSRPRLFAFAASIAAALVIGTTLWLSRPSDSLAAEIVTHVEGEPDSWHQTQPVPAEKLDAVLRKSGVKLGSGMEPVVYASGCWFRGHFVPHVVVTTKDGPVTVMILIHEHIKATQPFNEDGFSGLLVPAPTGSVAVLSRTPMGLERPAAEVVRALQSAK